MGGGSWNDKDWAGFTSTRMLHDDGTKKSTREVFTSSHLPEEFNPLKFKVREARDNDEHPNSLPVLIALDVTGSMASVVHDCLSQLGTFVTTAYDKNVVTDMQLAFAGIGDVEYDDGPVQMTQFESDARIADQLSKLYLEGGGGGNRYESYIAAWYLAAKKVSFDAFEKRGKKGFLFTIGDEEITPKLTLAHIKEFISADEQSSYTNEELYALASQYWNIYHVIVEEGSHARSHPEEVKNSWVSVLGQRVIRLKKTENLAEVLVSTLQLANGMTKEEILADWDGSTALATISHAIQELEGTSDDDNGLVAIEE